MKSSAICILDRTEVYLIDMETLLQIQLQEAVGLHGPRLPHVHRVPGPGQHRVRPHLGRGGRVQAAVGADGLDGDGPADAAPRRQDRGGHGAAPGGALPHPLPHRTQVSS